MQLLSIEGLAFNFLKYKWDGEPKIDHQINAAIFPFAQKEMVNTFMEGINPLYEKEIRDILKDILLNYPSIILGFIKNIYENEKNQLQSKLQEISDSEIDKTFEYLNKYKQENFINPILKVVSFLPKDELASMAESLVNLTSFKRKISLDAETVGGPIDVAVISKGDGFIWIKRKHYFTSEMNPHFFTNYYRSINHEQTG